MTKTHAELLRCPFCGEEAYLSENFIYCGGSIYDVYESGCSNYKCITNKHKGYDAKEEVIDKWNTRANKEAEFLEELKKYINGSQLPYYESADLDNTNTELISELKILLEKIEQFQAEQKQVSDEK